MLCFLFLSLLVGVAAHAEDDVVALINEGNRLVSSRTQANCDLGKTTGEIPMPKFRPTPQEIAAAEEQEQKSAFSERTTITDFNGRKLPITVISEDKIKALKGMYYADQLYDPAICAMRAHVIGRQLEEQGIETVKVFVEPEQGYLWDGTIQPDDRAKFKGMYKPQWKYHVANLIYVRKANGQLVQYVLDPGMEAYPVPRAQWEKRMTGVASSTITSRYVDNPDNKYRHELSYDREEYKRISQIVLSGRPIEDSTFIPGQ